MDLLNHIIDLKKTNPKLATELISNCLSNYNNLSKSILNDKIKIKKIKLINNVIKEKHSKGEALKSIILFFKINKHEDLVKYLLVKEFKYDENEIEIIYHKLNKIKKSHFKWRLNQLKAIENVINSNFVSGIHSQSVGAGKSLIGLKIMWEYHKKYPKENLLWICERKDIPEKLFFKKEKKANNKLSLKIDYEKSIMWKENDIIDLSCFNVIEMILNKPKKYYEILNKNKDKPYLLVVNRAFITTKDTNSNIYKYTKIKNIPKFCVIDECHSCMSSETYLLLNHMKYMWDSIIQGLSATPYRYGKSKTKSLSNISIDNTTIHKDNLDTSNNVEKLINIFHKPNNKHQLNILSWFNMKQAIEEGVILEPIFHWYEIKEMSEEDARKKNYKYTTKEIK